MQKFIMERINFTQSLQKLYLNEEKKKINN